MPGRGVAGKAGGYSASVYSGKNIYINIPFQESEL